jgi:OOP family OmpA-OmpF porin
MSDEKDVVEKAEDLAGDVKDGAGNVVGAATDKAGDLAGDAVSGTPKWLIPGLIGLAVIAGPLYTMKGCGTTTTTPPTGGITAPEGVTQKPINPEGVATPAAEASPAPEASPAATEAALTDVKLPDGTTLKGAAEGIESKLVGFAQDAAKLVDKETWFNFDRLLFDTGKSTLNKAGSQAQLENMVAILKAFPTVSLKVGGYTDNTGNKDANMKLSADRATAVVAALVTMGVDKARLEGEGYGDQNPVADNATEEGRAKNRRIAVCVTKK